VAPTVQSDLYATGALLGALLLGSLRAMATRTPEPDDPPELALAHALLRPDPAERPSIDVVLAILRARVADVRDLGAAGPSESGVHPARRESRQRTLGRGVEITAAETWSEDRLDALCEASNPWLQPILDRAERTLVLAPWPEGSASLEGAEVSAWRELLPPMAFEFEDDDLTRAVDARLRPSSLVRTPSGQWMIALDDLLTR
jgi:hypothetical protein